MIDAFFYWLEHTYQTGQVLPNLGGQGQGVHGHFDGQNLTIFYGAGHNNAQIFTKPQIKEIFDRFCELIPERNHIYARMYNNADPANQWANPPVPNLAALPFIPCFFMEFLDWVV